MNYKILFSDSAKNDLKDIHDYIYYELKVPKSAQKIVKNILIGIENLKQMPERHCIYSQEPMKSKAIRFFCISKYIVFYKVSKEQKNVLILRIIYGGRDIKNQFIETVE